MRTLPPPRDEELEQAVIGACLVSKRAYDVVAEILTPRDFYLEKHRELFRAIALVVEDGEEPERVAVLKQCTKEVSQNPELLKSYAEEVYATFPTPANVDKHAGALRSYSLRRELMDLAARAEVAASGEGEKEAVAASEELYRAATNTRADRDVYTFATGKDAYEERVLKRMAGVEVMGIPTGLKYLDRSTTGWHKGDLIILGARPSMAKTVYIWQAAITAARHGHRVFVMNLEMAYERIQERCACATGGVSYETWRRGRFSEDDATSLITAYDDLSKLPIYTHNPKAGRTFEDLKRAVRALKPQIVFVDYLQLLASEKASRTDLYTAVTLVSNDLKQLAVSENIPVVCAAQLSRRVEERFDKRPVMADLRESGYLEQDADVILMMYRDAYYYPDGYREGRGGEERVPHFHPQKVEFIARKDREGGNWAVDAYFEGERMWLSDHPYDQRGAVAS